MVDNSFFEETTVQSQIKAEIVEKYFDTWAGIVTATQNRWQHEKRIGYVDLFAGPGRYKSGAISTPIRVLQRAIKKPIYAERLLAIFNDKDEENVKSLQSAIDELPGINNLKHKPYVWHKEVGDEIAADFERINTIPLLAFVDPWGYRGLTLRLVNSFIKSWGCDCIFFFNYARINAGLNNPLVHEHMCALFGEDRARSLRDDLEPMSPLEREATIVNDLSLALKNFDKKQKRFVLPFCFKDETGKRTKHHLVLVTKHFKGYDVMKEIMARYSSSDDQGVPSFTFSPAMNTRQQLLFQLRGCFKTILTP
ncbi:MAG: three-Cys-motif partner protein TcmP [Planctomycetes bacterium]|nr:three-Cys-motif partner protein TcmP [Planctomycetota bacterium]